MTERAFQRIKNDYKVDLFQDDILVNGLVLHLASNFSRYLLGMETENLFYNDVLESYPTAYYYAMEVAEEISVWTKLSLSKYEISFLGMHFASYLERSLKSKSGNVRLFMEAESDRQNYWKADCIINIHISK